MTELEGSNPETFEDAARIVFDELYDLMVAKQKDYGPTNIMETPYGPEIGLTVRMWDKFARLRNLVEKNRNPLNESLDDTFKDIANYAIIALMVRRGIFVRPLRMEKDEKEASQAQVGSQSGRQVVSSVAARN